MDMKFNSSRKYVSISIPSKSQVMSPHIKSVDDIIVLGINLSKFNKPTQFFICVLGVFLFYLIYGYLQELIFSVDGFKSFGWYLTLVQFGFYSIFGLIELQLIQDKRRRIPGKTYMIIAFLTVGTMGLSNTSLGYLNYPTQVIFKCCKLIPVMIGGIFIQGKRYNIVDVSAAVCMSLGLIWFTLADSTIAPNFNLTGVVLISLALCADAVIGNVQEKAMKLHSGSNSEMVLYSYSIGFLYILLGLTCTAGLTPAVTFCSKRPVQTYGYAFLFSLTGYFGISFVLALIKIFGVLLAVTVTTGRKAMTIVLSFLFFAKPFTFQLCGFEPFYDERGDQYMFKRILNCEYDFVSPWWDDVSLNAKDLVRKLIVLDPKKRLTTFQALQHPWVTGKAANFIHMDTAQKKLQEFNARRKLKAAVKAVVASTRLGSASYHSTHESNKLSENQLVSSEDDTEEKETAISHITQETDIQEQGSEGGDP